LYLFNKISNNLLPGTGSGYRELEQEVVGIVSWNRNRKWEQEAGTGNSEREEGRGDNAYNIIYIILVYIL
jgi:hypothetical protein